MDGQINASGAGLIPAFFLKQNKIINVISLY
jgi:hypothetical protein